MSRLTDEVLQYLTDDIDAIETTCPQGLLRRLSMRVRELEAAMCTMHNFEDSRHIEKLEALLRHAAEGTWWDGNEPFTIQRLESWIVAALNGKTYTGTPVKVPLTAQDKRDITDFTRSDKP